MMTTVVQIVWVVAAAGLIILVLLHSPKGDGLGALGGQAQLFTSTKSAETALNRATWTLTVLFMAMTVVLSAPGFLNAPNPQPPAATPIESPTSPAALPDAAQPLPSELPAPTEPTE